MLNKNASTLVQAINAKIQAGEFPSERRGCLCGSELQHQVSNVDWLGLTAQTVICHSCGLMRLNPRLSKAGYSLFYGSDEYRRLHSGEEFIADAERRVMQKQGGQILALLEPYLTHSERLKVLELGCGGGWNLLRFDAQRFETRGYDLSPGLVEFGVSKGLDLRLGALEAAESDYGWADLVILNHVLEHLNEPADFLRRLREKLKPSALVYIGVPNIDNFNTGQLQLAHTYYFSPRTLRYYLQSLGFAVAELGPAQNIHMHAILTPGEARIEPQLLRGEYARLMRIIRNHRLRSRAVRALDSLGIKGLLKSALGMNAVKSN
ncbi:MAG: class I SAM-dependent methyltransferase [Oligoflexia bacterium]|nr:class I SAM-dependent methyltransferase [Oligoflexia bacterium]